MEKYYSKIFHNIIKIQRFRVSKYDTSSGTLSMEHRENTKSNISLYYSFFFNIAYEFGNRSLIGYNNC